MAQHERIDDAEDGDVGADAESQDQDGDNGEAGVAAQGAESVFEVLEQNIECHQSPRLALLFSCLFHAADADECLAASFFGR